MDEIEYEDITIRLPKGLVEAVKDEVVHTTPDRESTFSSLVREALEGWFLL